MGSVRGDVHVFGISGLLQMLPVKESHGYLTIRQGELEKVMEFTPSGIRLLSASRRTHPLGEILLRSNKVDRPQLEKLLEEQREKKIPLGQLVRERGLLDDKVITSALREQVAEEIYDLFTWDEASFEFIEAGDAPAPASTSPLSSVVLDANMMSLLLEAARRVDELTSIQELITGNDVVVERLELPAELDDPGMERAAIEEILPLIDGSRTVGNIIETSLFPRFTVLRTLYGLTLRGVLKLRDMGEGLAPGETIVLKADTRRRRRTPKGGDRVVLLASDLPTFREVLARRLRREGYRVLEGSCEEGELKKLYDAPVDAVILDVSLESPDGLAVCRETRERVDAPMLVLSGNNSKEAISNAMSSGARYVLLKPFKAEHLLDRLATVLRLGISRDRKSSGGEVKAAANS